MDAYHVTVVCGAVTHQLNVRARNQDEAMDEALRDLHLDYRSADLVRVTPPKLPRGRLSARTIDERLRLCGRERRLAVLDYETLDGETRTYKVQPYSYRGHGRQFFGYDVLDRKIKAFETARIIRVEATTQRFRPRWQVELA